MQACLHVRLCTSLQRPRVGVWLCMDPNAVLEYMLYTLLPNAVYILTNVNTVTRTLDSPLQNVTLYQKQSLISASVCLRWRFVVRCLGVVRKNDSDRCPPCCLLYTQLYHTEDIKMDWRWTPLCTEVSSVASCPCTNPFFFSVLIVLVLETRRK